MKQFEAPLTWILGIAFVTYMTLTNCCSERSMQSVLSGDNTNVNTPALTTEHVNLNQPIHISEELIEVVDLDAVADIDTLTIEEDKTEELEE